MLTETEELIRNKINTILDSLSHGKYACQERKDTSDSVIGKPVDLQVKRKKDNSVVLAVEVATVNTTQLVNEACRLYFDKCPRKLLIIEHRHGPKNAVEQCAGLLSRLYGQDSINDTPARVAWFDDNESIQLCLEELLLL